MPTDKGEGLRGDAAWRAERQRVADRNGEARKQGMKERREHEARIAGYRDASRDSAPTPRPPA